jgi:dTDP-4-dehydrorhamnose 3,5-epimerase
MQVEPSSIIDGVRLHRLARQDDERGSLVELHRVGWLPELGLVQWNSMASVAGSLRGLHVHRRHCDLLFVLDGRMRLGLKDLRRGSATRLAEQVVELRGTDPVGVFIPDGVAHGFYAHTATTLLYGVDRYFDPADELACRWDDPAVRLFADVRAPLISSRDAAAPSLATLCAELEREPA